MKGLVYFSAATLLGFGIFFVVIKNASADQITPDKVNGSLYIPVSNNENFTFRTAINVRNGPASASFKALCKAIPRIKAQWVSSPRRYDDAQTQCDMILRDSGSNRLLATIFRTPECSEGAP